jgi:hypothetical protein
MNMLFSLGLGLVLGLKRRIGSARIKTFRRKRRDLFSFGPEDKGDGFKRVGKV